MTRYKICPYGIKWKVKWKKRFFWYTLATDITFAGFGFPPPPRLFDTEEQAVEHIRKLQEIDRKVAENERRGCREIMP